MQFSLVALLATISAAAAVPAKAPAPPLSFGMMSLRSASPVHFGTLNAVSQKFYIGVEKPTTWCPKSVPRKECPSGQNTAFTMNAGRLYLNVKVPGGQRVYIACDRSLSYTQAHSASIPAGSIETGWTLGPKQENSLRAIGHGSDGFYACPKAKNTAPWKIYVGLPKDKDTPSKKASDCLPFGNYAVEFTSEKYGAWQY
ncbi:hypothetical protein DRE_04019 [Drechslerella stenobrocha 248]|uniref:IgE-binding protein n=1 Tax=Drechslerella stenobrocha 248 TaxID=1043628 RepID=W7HTM5_9PEZI|nr:hypothetical protein DRE_04019 [Drechslerella stenobrocha 248]